MSEHTAGKLRFERRYSNGCEVCPEIFADNGRWIGGVHGSPHLGHKDTIPNARRLVAAWNLCDGVPTEMIEGMDLGRLLAERGELMEALKEAREELRLVRMKDGAVYDPTLCVRIDTIIAKAEGKS